MKYLFPWVLATVVIFAGVGNAQNQSDKSVLLASFQSTGDDILQGIYHLEDRFNGIYNPASNKLAIRICSRDPMPVALATASGLPMLVTAMLQEKGASTSNMVYLRSEKNCNLNVEMRAVTEYWLTPNTIEFPEFVEARSVKNVANFQLTNAGLWIGRTQFDGLSADSENLTPESYSLALKRLVEMLKADRSAVAVISIPYYPRSSSAEMNKRIEFTKNVVRENDLGNFRIYFKKYSIGRKPNQSFDDPIYPDVVIVSEK